MDEGTIIYNDLLKNGDTFSVNYDLLKEEEEPAEKDREYEKKEPDKVFLLSQFARCWRIVWRSVNRHRQVAGGQVPSEPTAFYAYSNDL